MWFKLKVGVRGLLVQDRQGAPAVFMLTRTATRYYEIMCRANWMPVLVDEVIYPRGDTLSARRHFEQ